jgi:hypothetical protein
MLKLSHRFYVFDPRFRAVWFAPGATHPVNRALGFDLDLKPSGTRFAFLVTGITKCRVSP